MKTLPDSADALWRALDAEAKAARATGIAGLFAADPGRFDALAHTAGRVLLDLSKTWLTPKALDLLAALARLRQVEAAREQLFTGGLVNVTENRPALHTVLRDPTPAPVEVAGTDVKPLVAKVSARMQTFTAAFHDGALKGADGRALRTVLALGIGGSDLGPRLVTRALRAPGTPPVVRFAANVDGTDIAEAMAGLDPRETLVIVASKSMGTQETMQNAATVREWLEAACGPSAWALQAVAVTAKPEKAAALGIAPDRVFPFWDWVGGRYSLWSAIGLPIALDVGWDAFMRLRNGAHRMDSHFRTAPLARNVPVLLALAGIWHRNVCGLPALAVVPYVQALDLLPDYLQQLEMESNGKSVGLDGARAMDTCPMLWGGVGTNGQHAFFQWLHQGSDVTPVEFIGVACPPPGALRGHHRLLMANLLAQSEALALGRTEEEAAAEMRAQGMAEGEAARLAPHRACPGNRPSVTLLLDQLEPDTLGALIALYEHKVFVQGVIWGVNSFDQWGVELGKVLASRLLGEGGTAPASGIGQGLLSRYNAWARPDDRLDG